MSKVQFDMEILESELLKELDDYIDRNEDPRGNIIQILHEAQQLFGYLPKEVQLHIARKTSIPTAKINGIVSFYSFFSEEPNGKYNVSVCLGTACFVKGADKVLDEVKKLLNLAGDKKVTDDSLFSISDIRCIGACGLAPVLRVNDKIYGHVETKDVAMILDHYRKLEEEK